MYQRLFKIERHNAVAVAGRVDDLDTSGLDGLRLIRTPSRITDGHFFGAKVSDELYAPLLQAEFSLPLFQQGKFFIGGNH